MTKMLTVYLLRDELEKDPESLKRAQAVSLDPAIQYAGITTRFGLYGTEDWWRNVEQGAVPRATYSGTIIETFYAGMDTDRRHNSFRMKTDDGREFSWGIVPENSSYKGLYRPGHRVEVITIFKEYKMRKPDGSHETIESPLEIKLSTKPVVGAASE
jgi:hypothetical protein